MTNGIPLARPFFGPEEEAAVREVLHSGWVSQGPKVEEFEKRLADLLGCREVCAVNSGTSALMLTLRGLGVGPGDSVVVPALSCAATALPVLETGARLLFADIDPATFNVTWDTIAAVLAPDTKAVIAVHMFGQAAEIDVVATECRRRNLALVEDTALAFGARKAGRLAGTFGVAGCFSFHPRKILTTGEGGAVCTNDPALAANIRADRNYGAARTAWARFQTGDGSPCGFSRLAFNCKLTDLQAAVGLAQLARLPQFLSQRRHIAQRYADQLSSCCCLIPPRLPASLEEHVFQAYVCTWADGPLVDLAADAGALQAAERRLNRFKESLRQRDVAVSDAAQYLPELPVFEQGRVPSLFPGAYAASRLAFAIPIFPGMTESQIDQVVEAICSAAQ
ncbi:MAG TPA: DegT/DnrJ/EryC1/StrS family aminotransferase [Candidatus Binatia bacterium]|jgi:perosamine synthetase|nr:DegT/DnrJ/EryC1/StrS family aminotransferase [Candidatus Binatia bacterium]